LIEYLKEAVANNTAGRKIEIKPEPQGPVDLPREIEQRLEESGLLKAYRGRTYYQQKGYLQWIEAVKQEATRERRIERMLEELREGTYMPPRRRPSAATR
jgi:uncharacterized protein YdeI (YjbR/CyaY-like superfamily)